MVKLLDQVQWVIILSFGYKQSYLLLAFPTTYFAEQGFCQVLHMHNKYWNCLDVNKTKKCHAPRNVVQLKLSSLQPALNNFADTHQPKGSHWLEPAVILEMIANAFAFVLFVLTRLSICISLAVNHFQNKIIFSNSAKITSRGWFLSKVSVRERFYTKGWRPLV